MNVNSMRHAQQRLNIVKNVLPEAVHRFLQKNQDYGTGSDEFGIKAQVIDISRKYKKIKAAIWDDEELTGEPLEEVCQDMIGHLLILLEILHERRPKHEHMLSPDLNFTADQWLNWYNMKFFRLFSEMEPDHGVRLEVQEIQEWEPEVLDG